MDFRQIETFLCVFEEGSVTRASEKLHIVQPAVSAQIKKLESDLRLSLFQRLPRGISPTPAGRALYRLFSPVMESFRAAEHQAYSLHGTDILEISIGLNPYAGTAIMSEVLQTFRVRYPKIGINIEEALSFVLLQRVAESRLDLAVVHFGPQSVGIPNNVVAEVLGEEHLVFVEGGLRASGIGPSIQLSDLAGRPLVLPKSHLGFRRDFEHAARQARTSIDVQLEIDQPAPLLDLVAKGGLAGVVPEIAARHAMQHLNLRMRRITEPAIVRTILCVHPNDRPPSPVLRDLIGIFRAQIGASLRLGDRLRTKQE